MAQKRVKVEVEMLVDENLGNGDIEEAVNQAIALYPSLYPKQIDVKVDELHPRTTKYDVNLKLEISELNNLLDFKGEIDDTDDPASILFNHLEDLLERKGVEGVELIQYEAFYLGQD